LVFVISSLPKLIFKHKKEPDFTVRRDNCKLNEETESHSKIEEFWP
jgi:hypothetical protein